MSEADSRGWAGVVKAWSRNRDWRKLFAARSTSLFGHWFNALAVVELLSTGSAAGSAIALAIVFVLKQAPITLLGPFAGVVADRFDRRRIMISCELLAAAVTLCYLLLEPGGSPLFVYALTGLQIGLQAFFLPAYQAALPNLVEDEDLTAANVASSAAWSIMFAAGTALGGIVLAVYGWRTAMCIDALSYAASALFVYGISKPTQEPRDPAREIAAATQALDPDEPAPRQVRREDELPGKAPSDGELLPGQAPSDGELLPAPQQSLIARSISDFGEGLAYILRSREIRRVMLVKFGWGSMGAITLWLTLLGRGELYRVGDNTTSGVSFLWACRAIGTLFGPFLAYRIGGESSGGLARTITWSFFAAPLTYVAFALTEHFWLGGFLVFFAHLFGSILWVISTVLLQRIVPDEYRGRTFAAELGLVMLSSSISMLAWATVIDLEWLTTKSSIIAGAGLCLLPAVLWLRSNSSPETRQ